MPTGDEVHQRVDLSRDLAIEVYSHLAVAEQLPAVRTAPGDGCQVTLEVPEDLLPVGHAALDAVCDGMGLEGGVVVGGEGLQKCGVEAQVARPPQADLQSNLVEGQLPRVPEEVQQHRGSLAGEKVGHAQTDCRCTLLLSGGPSWHVQLHFEGDAGGVG